MVQDPQPQSPTAADVQQAVAEVFEDPALQEALRPRRPPPRQVTDLVEWLWDLYASVMDWLDELRLSSPGLYWLTIVVLIAVLGLLIWHIVWTFSAAFRRHAPATELTGDEAHTERIRHYEDERRRADEQAARGNYAQAARALLFALLARLDERRVLRYARGWTNREILRRLAARAAIGADLQDFGSAVERACYGARDLRAEEYERVRVALDHIVEQIGTGPAP